LLLAIAKTDICMASDADAPEKSVRYVVPQRFEVLHVGLMFTFMSKTYLRVTVPDGRVVTMDHP